MLGQTRPAWWLLGCLSLIAPNFVLAQDNSLHFTSGVSNPSPQPGQPFTITWTGGDPTGAIYIVRQYLFPNTPNQDTYYGSQDILSNAPNNGSWVYNVPSDIFPGRYAFSIGVNPFLLSDSTPSFTIVNSIPSSSASPPSQTTAGSAGSYNGCGLVPLPDFTYTGYQAPCTYSSNGHIETIYPVVPASLSESFYGSNGVFKTNTYLASLITPPGSGGSPSSTTGVVISTSPTAFASGVYAQALQCASAIIPAPVTITASGTTTVFTTVECPMAPASTASAGDGVCHSTGYTTFSVSGTRSVCCPTEWATTPLASGLYCYTSAPAVTKKAEPQDKRAAAGAVTTLTGLVFTSAGVVRNVAAASPAAGGAAQTSSAKNDGQPTIHDHQSWTALLTVLGLLYRILG